MNKKLKNALLHHVTVLKDGQVTGHGWIIYHQDGEIIESTLMNNDGTELTPDFYHLHYESEYPVLYTKVVQ